LGCGTVFKLTPSGSGYTEKVIYAFKTANDGEYPLAGLIADSTDALYGTTSLGGGYTKNCYPKTGCGTVFKLNPSGRGYTKSTLYRFKDGKDGAKPVANLIIDKSGAVYSTTAEGGGQGPSGDGTVFRVKP